MRVELLIPLLLLVLTGVGLVVISRISARRKLLEQRVLANVPHAASTAQTARSFGSEVRVRTVQASHELRLSRLLNIPVDLPLADVLSPVTIIVVVTLIAAVTAWGSHLIAPWWASMLDAVFLWIVLTRMIFGWELGRYRGRLLRQLPDTIHLVISATRAGLPVSEAFRTVMQEMPNPTGAEFARVVDEMNLGVAADEALLNMNRRTGVTEYAIFAVTIGVQARSGGRLAETITNLADTVRERRAIAGKARAVSAEARTAAVIMAVLPIITGGLLSISRPGYLRPLLDTPTGQTMLTVGVVSMVLGIITMRQLIAGATRD